MIRTLTNIPTVYSNNQTHALFFALHPFFPSTVCSVSSSVLSDFHYNVKVIQSKVQDIESEASGMNSEVSGIESEASDIESKVPGMNIDVSDTQSEALVIASKVPDITSEVRVTPGKVSV